MFKYWFRYSHRKLENQESNLASLYDISKNVQKELGQLLLKKYLLNFAS